MSYIGGGGGGGGGVPGYGAGGGGRGRGEYYKNKYGNGNKGRGRNKTVGGRGGRRRGRGGFGTTIPVEHRYAYGRTPREGGGPGGTYEQLQQLLLNLDGQSYGGYHALDTILTTSNHQGWNHPDGFRLFIERAQSDPYAPPTRCRIVVNRAHAGFPNASLRYLQNKIRSMALSDYLLRTLAQTCKLLGADTTKTTTERGHHNAVPAPSTGGWKDKKGGDIQILEPCQHVLEQSAVRVDPKTGNIVVQMTINLPAQGRNILGRDAEYILCTTVPKLVARALCYESLASPEHLLHHLDIVEDQIWLQQQLETRNIVAFVRNGAILPRMSGADDRPMICMHQSYHNIIKPVPFVSPPRFAMDFTLPNSGTTITGMGVPHGITLICGGGFHGKSTLLATLQVGIYPKISGDGREFCMTSPAAVKIRAEDGRNICAVDISNFITNLPYNKNTTSFTSPDASGSTSQAAAIVEALECGANTLLVDEDTCATNFMIRDEKMMQLVESAKEPITPFVRLVRSLYDDFQVSSVLVIGGTGDYFDVADNVLVMDSYQCLDATEKAKRIVANSTKTTEGMLLSSLSTRSTTFRHLQGIRRIHGPAFVPNGKVKTITQDQILYNEADLDLKCLEQLVTKAQTTAIASTLQCIPDIVANCDNLNNTTRKNNIPSTLPLYGGETQERGQHDDGRGRQAGAGNFGISQSLMDTLTEIEKRIDYEGLDCLTPGQCHGQMARPRLFEIAGAINRLRRDNTILKK